ncbi:response regulator transcription factor [Arcobacter peruensis]|uniref:response regulator transcription factor n=1 Tax=Arcobacter peruensis TaxID=2320140 RepID=UPI000F07F36C|nr:response regulator transcription factor [Arcobacter peruensis]
MNIQEYKKSLTILYIEDDEVMSNKLKNILEKIYYKVLVAKNGKEAYSIFLESNNIDLVISDINMPQMNGLEFLEKLRSHDENMPFVFLTGRNESSKMLKAIDLNITNYLLKPIDLDKLLSVLNQIAVKKLKQSNSYQLNEDILLIDNEYIWNYSSNTLHKNNKEVELTKKELYLLTLLFSTVNRIYSTNDIIEHIWKESFEIKDYNSSLKNLISRLKKKLPSIDIKNCYGLGYKIQIKERD